jgi:hypothetical protein
MTYLTPLIEQVKTATHPYVVLTVDEDGVRWKDESKASCLLIAAILGNCAVMTREEFIEALNKLEDD